MRHYFVEYHFPYGNEEYIVFSQNIIFREWVILVKFWLGIGEGFVSNFYNIEYTILAWKIECLKIQISLFSLDIEGVLSKK